MAGLFTTIVNEDAAEVRTAVSAGVNVVVSVCVPAASTVPAGGEYTNVPGTFAVASSCAEVSGAGFLIGAGCGQVITAVGLEGFR